MTKDEKLTAITRYHIPGKNDLRTWLASIPTERLDAMYHVVFCHAQDGFSEGVDASLAAAVAVDLIEPADVATLRERARTDGPPHADLPAADLKV